MARDYDNISKPTGVCSACGRTIGSGEPVVATVREADDDFERRDFCPACWDGADAESDPAVMAVWRTRTPEPTEKKKLFVDDDVLLSFFRRLEDADTETKLSFRFVLALVLMRKKLLAYEGSENLDDGTDVWTMRYKGGEETCRVINPGMDEEKIADVSRHLNQILETEL